MKIFITGSEGFIGSHLVEGLVKKKFKVKALIQYNSFNSYGWIDTFDEKGVRGSYPYPWGSPMVRPRINCISKFIGDKVKHGIS